MIYFHTKVNEKVGLGNLSRCIIICDEIQRMGVKVKLFVHGSSKYKKCFQFQDIYFFDSEYTLINRLIAESNKLNQAKGIVLVADLPVLDESLLKNYKNIKMHTLLSINDQYVTDLNPNVYINSDEVMNIDTFQGEKYIGLKYQIIRRDLARYRPRKFQKVKEIKNVAFIFGGSDPGYLIEETLSQMRKKKLSYAPIMVIGPGIEEIRKAKLLCTSKENVNFTINPDIPNLISEADLIVTMGGMTSYEAMYLGKPVFAVEWEYMSKYVKYLDSEGLIVSLGSKENYIDRLTKLTTNLKLIERVAKKGYFTIDGLGNKRVADIIISTTKDFKMR